MNAGKVLSTRRLTLRCNGRGTDRVLARGQRPGEGASSALDTRLRVAAKLGS